MKSVAPQLMLLALLAGAACGGSGDAATEPGGEKTIDRETFVDVYVELRRAALATGGEALTPGQRQEVLDEHGVSEEDLLTFALVHGGDTELMREVWSEVEERLEALDEQGRPRSPPPDTASADSAG